MNNFKLQVPLDKKTKNEADKKAEELGFSSLQELVRVLLKNFSAGKINLFFHPYEEYLSEKEEKRLLGIERRLNKEIGSGKNKPFSSIEEMKKHLLK
jgi:hypothetical protein